MFKNNFYILAVSFLITYEYNFLSNFLLNIYRASWKYEKKLKNSCRTFHKMFQKFLLYIFLILKIMSLILPNHITIRYNPYLFLKYF